MMLENDYASLVAVVADSALFSDGAICSGLDGLAAGFRGAGALFAAAFCAALSFSATFFLATAAFLAIAFDATSFFAGAVFLSADLLRAAFTAEAFFAGADFFTEAELFPAAAGVALTPAAFLLAAQRFFCAAAILALPSTLIVRCPAVFALAEGLLASGRPRRFPVPPDGVGAVVSAVVLVDTASNIERACCNCVICWSSASSIPFTSMAYSLPVKKNVRNTSETDSCLSSFLGEAFVLGAVAIPKHLLAGFTTMQNMG